MGRRTICGVLAALFIVSALTGCTAEPQESVDPQNCPHEQHDSQTTRCLVCNTKIDHRYIGDTCKLCGKKTPFMWDSIAASTELMDCLKAGGHANQGTIDTITYETLAYNIQALTGEEVYLGKTAYVYLPYGYDASKQYNVLFLLHGSTDNEGYWFAQGNYTPEDSTYFSTGNYTKELLDYMMGEKLCEECIVVTPSIYNVPNNYQEENNVVTTLFGHELIEYLLPEIVKTYSTYATDLEDVKQNREHFAYAGFSLGSMTSFGSIFSYCLPYFAYVGSFSGPAMDVDSVVEALNGEYKDYSINYWYCAIGDQDRTGGNFYQAVHSTYKQLVGRVDRLVDDENCALVDIYGGNHTYECSLTNLCNAMQKFFR